MTFMTSKMVQKEWLEKAYLYASDNDRKPNSLVEYRIISSAQRLEKEQPLRPDKKVSTRKLS